MYKFVHSRCRR